MMKFNQIVRASVLAITLVGGGFIASQAFAYDTNDYNNAVAAETTAFENWQSAIANSNDLSNRVNAVYPQYLTDQEGCYTSFQAGGGWNVMDYSDCMDAAESKYEMDLAIAQADYNAAVSDEFYYEALYGSAQSWTAYVADHQNGIPGQP